ncbi:MAG TPA: ATP-dependent DNA helicase [Alphaproteobacteria bacterium]|nr:ATP-dependent DNA helicase [Alphaproteobacteria bacterium]
MNHSELLEIILSEPRPLSPPQREAVVNEGRHIRVIAGAGAGKTETLTRRIVKLLLIDEVAPGEIVAFTFTEKAAQSMKSRIYERLRQLGGDEVCARLGEMYIGTIHAFCFRLLHDYFNYGAFDALDENQEMAFLLRFGWSLHLRGERSHSENCELFMQSLNVAYAEMIPDNTLERRASSFNRAKKHYEEILDSHRRLTFNRMIALAVQHLQEKPETLSHIRHLIVDEYQDINRAQERLIQLIGHSGNIFIVGDPRQTIYQFRGSDAHCFEEFVRNYPDSETISISQNRRSVPLIVTLANDFADHFERERYDHLEAVRREQGGVYLGEFSSDISEAAWVADQIEHYVGQGQCSYGDIGILFRSVNTSGPAFIDEFRRRRIPFIVGGKVGLFRRSEVQAVGKLIAWLARDGFFQKSRFSREAVRGDALVDIALSDWQDAVPEVHLPADMGDILNDWKNAVLNGDYHHFTAVYQELLSLLGFHQLDPNNREHAVIMANLGRFGTLLTDFETANRLGGRSIHWEADTNGLCWFMNTYAMGAYEEHSGDDIRGIDAVQLMTVHQAKGLEWPLVFVPSVVSGRFPSRMAGSRKRWLIPRELFDVFRYEGDVEGEKKLMYVGLTRARDVLVVSYFTSMNGRRKGLSDFISEDLATGIMTRLTDRNMLPLHDLILQGDPDEIQSFSAGELILYGRCPFMYRLNRLWGFQPGLTDYLGYGNTLHFCMRVAAERIKEGYSPISAVASAVDAHFFLPFADSARHQKVKEIAKRKLIEFAREHQEDLRRIREVETRIEYPMHRATVVGKIDVILHDDEGIEIRDYKSSDVVTTQDEVAMQLRLYAQGLTVLGESVNKGSVAYLENATIAPVEVGGDALQEAEKIAERHIDGITSGIFTPCPGGACERCDYGNICRFRRI